MKFKKILLLVITLIFIFTGTTFAADINPNQVTVPSAILVETATNKILYEKNSKQKMYPASTTKVMTAIIVLENCSLDEKVTISYNAIGNIPKGYTTAELLVDEVLTVEQLLHLLLIESASDAANALAEHVAGSIESFASMMNTKAHELGCTNTNFVNPDGQHNENHYSTAQDLYLIANYAMKNDTFRNIVRKSLYVLYPTNIYSTERKYTNTNQLLNTSSKFYDRRVIGTKTGFTTPAGNCLITCAVDNGMEIMSVVLGGLVEEDNTSQRYTSTLNLINYAFDNYAYKTLHEQNGYFETLEIKNATSETKYLKVLVQDEIKVFIDKDTLNNNPSPKVELKENLFAPIKAGDVVGTISYNILGIDYSSNLIAANDVIVSELALFVFILGIFIFAFCIILMLIRKIRA